MEKGVTLTRLLATNHSVGLLFPLQQIVFLCLCLTQPKETQNQQAADGHSTAQHSTATFIACPVLVLLLLFPLPLARRRHQIPNRNPAAIRSLRAKSAHASSAFRLTGR
jgi:hypothetical protein